MKFFYAKFIVMKKLMIIILVIHLFSCNKETSQSTVYKTKYINNSNHNIKIKNLIFKVIEISSGNTHEESRDVEGIDGDENPVNLNMDTVEIIYNDTLSIKHPGSFYTVKKDIRNPENYNNKKEENDFGVIYTHSYTFTNEDFREADSIIN